MKSNVATTFEVDHQSGQNISNIGGDQTIYYGDRNRAGRIGKILGTLGLFLCLVGVALLVPIGVTTANHLMHAVGGVQAPYTQYLPSIWPAALALLVAGLVVTRFARIMVGR
ncbi:MAG: hypothetical protein ACXVFQ_23375 [Solirubrobacteraceae bacterium]